MTKHEQHDTRSTGAIGARVRVATLLVAFVLFAAFAQVAEARGRHGRRTVVVPRVSVGFYGGFYGPYWGSPFYSRYGYLHSGVYRPYREHGGISPALARALDVGALDLVVKPGKAEVFVDGAYVGLARDFDGTPSFLWLDEGNHELVIRKGGYASYQAIVDVRGGVVGKLKVRLDKGAT